MDGWIKLHRKFLDWEWYDTPAVKSVFLHLLLTANIESRKWRGIEIKRGQTVTSFEKISKATGHSIQEVRTAINKLKSTQCVTQSKYSKFSVFTVINFDSYQNATEFLTGNQQATNTQSTGNQQATNNTIRNKEYKKERSKEDTPPTPSKGADGAETVCQNQGESLKVLKTAGGNTSHSTTLDEDFNRFWQAYPRKAKKQDALKAWKRLKPNEDFVNILLNALEEFKKSSQWNKDNGDYIPYPATWLNGRRWEEITDDCDTGNVKSNSEESGTPKYGTTF